MNGKETIGGDDFNISMLREYVVLAQVLNFTKAAGMLGTTQATLSRHLAALERSLGVRLVDRDAKPICLTAQGKAFLEEAHRITEGFDSTMRSIRSLVKAEKRALSVGGLYHHGAVEMMTEVLYRYELEGVRIDFSHNIEQGPSFSEIARSSKSDVLIMLDDGELDLSDYHVRPLFQDEVMLVLPRHHALAGRETVGLRDLQGVEFAEFSSNLPYEVLPAVKALFEKRGEDLHYTIKIRKQLEAGLSQDSFTPHFIPAFSASFYPMLRTSAYSCKVLDGDGLRLDYRVAYRKDSRNPFAAEFVERLCAAAVPDGLTAPSAG